MTPADLVEPAASGAGRLLGAAARVAGVVRRPDKPLHPDGMSWTGRIVRNSVREHGIDWFDQPESDQVVVRRSRAAGLPPSWPDVHGLAMRVVLQGGRTADVLLATTGAGAFSRFALRPTRRPEEAFFGSLLPYRTTQGPVVVGASTRDEVTWDLLFAPGRAPWRPFARLVLGEVTDEEPSFDPVLNPPPGLAQYDAWARLRLPAYRSARRSRGDSEPEGAGRVRVSEG